MQFLGGGKLAFTKQLQEQFADVPESERKQKIEEYVKAMGYDKPETVLVS